MSTRRLGNESGEDQITNEDLMKVGKTSRENANKKISNTNCYRMCTPAIEIKLRNYLIYILYNSALKLCLKRG